eukprot:scpid38620/ scgid24225/ 
MICHHHKHDLIIISNTNDNMHNGTSSHRLCATSAARDPKKTTTKKKRKTTKKTGKAIHVQSQACYNGGKATCPTCPARQAEGETQHDTASDAPAPSDASSGGWVRSCTRQERPPTNKGSRRRREIEILFRPAKLHVDNPLLEEKNLVYG